VVEHGLPLCQGETSSILTEFWEDRIGAMVQTERDERGTHRQSEGGDRRSLQEPHRLAAAGHNYASDDEGGCNRTRPQDVRGGLLGRAHSSDRLLREYLPASFWQVTGEGVYGRKTRLPPGGRCVPTRRGYCPRGARTGLRSATAAPAVSSSDFKLARTVGHPSDTLANMSSSIPSLESAGNRLFL
jgi:hypothetical protein